MERNASRTQQHDVCSLLLQAIENVGGAHDCHESYLGVFANEIQQTLPSEDVEALGHLHPSGAVAACAMPCRICTRHRRSSETRFMCQRRVCRENRHQTLTAVVGEHTPCILPTPHVDVKRTRGPAKSPAVTAMYRGRLIGPTPWPPRTSRNTYPIARAVASTYQRRWRR